MKVHAPKPCIYVSAAKKLKNFCNKHTTQQNGAYICFYQSHNVIRYKTFYLQHTF